MSERRAIREALISAGLLALATRMDMEGPEEFLSRKNFDNPELAMQVFADMMRQRDLWEAHAKHLPVKTPPAEVPDHETEHIYIPGKEYPGVGTRPVQWKQTKIHHSAYAFKFTHLHHPMPTVCGLTVPYLAVILPESAWTVGSDQVCKTCAIINH